MRTNAKKVELLFIFFVVCVIVCLIVYNFKLTVNWIHNSEKFNERQLYYDATTPEWVYEEKSLRRTSGDEVKVRTIHYRSRLKGNVYGAGKVIPRATTNQGFARKLRRYERQDVIYVPEISADSVKCDAWMGERAITLDTLGRDKFGETKLFECDIEKGETACFKCIESRKYLRSCVHVKHDLTVNDRNDDVIVIPKNRDSSVGWCLPKNFENIDQDADDGGATGIPKEIDRNCNPKTGKWLLAQLGDDGGNFDSSYNWICKCTYPNLMTNLTSTMSDCMRPVGCGDHGELDELSRKGLVDPYREGRCVCDNFYESSFEDSTGPVCVPRNIGKAGKTLHQLYLENDMTWGEGISHDYVTKLLVNSIDRKYRAQSIIPNPCNVDALTGIYTNGCKAVKTRIDGKDTVICVSVRGDHVTATNDSDYLLNNNGKYPNVCVKVIDDRAKRYPSNESSYMELPFVLSGFNRKWLPDFGVIIPLSEISTLRKLYKSLWKNDAGMRDWYARNVTAPKPFGGERYAIRHSLEYLDSESVLVVYENFPNTGKGGYYSPAHNFVFGYLQNWKIRKMFALFAQNYDKFYREYYGVRDTWWWEQSRGQYNRDKARGRLPNGTTYFDYIKQNKEIGKQIYRMRQLFLSVTYDDSMYPGIPYSCPLCGDSGSKSGEYVRQNIIPSLVPFYYESNNRPIYMNGKYFSFDGTCIIYMNNSEMVFVAERFMHNFLNHHYRGLSLQEVNE